MTSAARASDKGRINWKSSSRKLCPQFNIKSSVWHFYFHFPVLAMKVAACFRALLIDADEKM